MIGIAIQIQPMQGSTVTVQPNLPTVVQFGTPPVTVIEFAKMGVQGLKGEKGDSNIQYAAGETISTGTAVIIKENLFYKFNPDDYTHIGRMVGVAKTSGTPAQPMTVQTEGVVTDPAYDFDVNKPCFVGTSGTITTTVPQGKIMEFCGLPINKNTFFLNILLPIKK